MDKINKNLLKIPNKQRKQVTLAVEKIVKNDLAGLDSKKLKNTLASYRVRVGKYRIIFTKIGNGKNIISAITKRDEKTYKNF